jgi:predicted ATPase
MRVSRISIHGLKSIDKLDIDLDSGITLLYGPNGIGKSSSLEALSLLGHIHHLPLVTLTNDNFKVVDSVADDKNTLPKHLESSGKHQTVAAWFEALKRGGAIEYTLRHDTIDGGKQFKIYIHVGINQSPDAQSSEPSLTRLLSRAFDDSSLKDYLCLMVDHSNESQTQKLAELIRKSTTYPRDKDAVLVSYINTDLNDFGRGNDLRESPKDLGKDFVVEMKGRLQIPFTGLNGTLKRLADLNTILKTVLKYPVLYVPGMTSDNTSFEISQCAINPVTHKLTFTVARLADNRDFSTIDFLSAGENECVFIFSLLLHLPLTGGLLLLDEPDLHLGPHQKRDFFATLYDQIKLAGCQCVIATHSEYALTDFKDVTYAVIRPVVVADGNDLIFHYVADSKIDLRLAHSKHLLSRAFHSLRYTGLFGKKALSNVAQNFGNLRSQVFFFVNIGLAVTFAMLVAVSAYSDILLVFFSQPHATHDKIADKLVIPLIASLLTLGVFVVWSIWSGTAKRREEQRLVQEAIRQHIARRNAWEAAQRN